MSIATRFAHVLYRICPGRYLALDTAWLGIASILQLFDISSQPDTVKNVKWNSGLVK